MLLVLAFVDSLLTVASLCVLPVLPVLLSGTVGSTGPPIGIVAGFVLRILFLSALVGALGISADTLRWVATALLLIFGLILATDPSSAASKCPRPALCRKGAAKTATAFPAA